MLITDLSISELMLLAMASGPQPLWTFKKGRETAEGMEKVGLLKRVPSDDDRAMGWTATQLGIGLINDLFDARPGEDPAKKLPIPQGSRRPTDQEILELVRGDCWWVCPKCGDIGTSGTSETGYARCGHCGWEPGDP